MCASGIETDTYWSGLTGRAEVLEWPYSVNSHAGLEFWEAEGREWRVMSWPCLSSCFRQTFLFHSSPSFLPVQSFATDAVVVKKHPFLPRSSGKRLPRARVQQISESYPLLGSNDEGLTVVFLLRCYKCPVWWGLSWNIFQSVMRLTFLGKNRKKHCVRLGIQSLLDAYTAKSTENFVVHFLIHLLISVTTIFHTGRGSYEIFKKVAVGYRFGPHCNVSFLPLRCFLFAIRFPIILLTKPAIQRLLWASCF